MVEKFFKLPKFSLNKNIVKPIKKSWESSFVKSVVKILVVETSIKVVENIIKMVKNRYEND